MRLLSNPIFLKMVLVFFASAFALVMAVLLMRRIRRSLGEEASLPDPTPSREQLPLHTYHAVIQQLKQQKHELQALQQAEQRRAKTSENISAAVLSNLSSGMLFFGANGLVRQANQAGKDILGIASPAGMDAAAIFRDASFIGSTGTISLSEAVQSALHNGTAIDRVAAEYQTPGKEPRTLEVTASRVPSGDGSVLGVACLIADRTEIANMRRQIELRGELSAEMALALRNSLATISGYARQLAQNRDPDLAEQLAADIAAEAKHLDNTIGGFLADNKEDQGRRNNFVRLVATPQWPPQ